LAAQRFDHLGGDEACETAVESLEQKGAVTRVLLDGRDLLAAKNFVGIHLDEHAVRSISELVEGFGKDRKFVVGAMIAVTGKTTDSPTKGVNQSSGLPRHCVAKEIATSRRLLDLACSPKQAPRSDIAQN
jgi:hypothetical protein